MSDGKADEALQTLELAEDQRAVRPWAGKRDIEAVAAGLRREAIAADHFAELWSAGARRHPLRSALLRRSLRHWPSITLPIAMSLKSGS